MPTLSMTHYMSALCLYVLLFIRLCHLALRREPSLQAHFSITLINNQTTGSNLGGEKNVTAQCFCKLRSFSNIAMLNYLPDRAAPEQFHPFLNNLQTDTVTLINMDSCCALCVVGKEKPHSCMVHTKKCSFTGTCTNTRGCLPFKSKCRCSQFGWTTAERRPSPGLIERGDQQKIRFT